MVVDYEAAWVRLQGVIAAKSQHGREATLKAMADIAEECRVPAGELSRLLRLYGVEVERARSIEADQDPLDEARFRAERLRSGIGSSRDIIDREGGHDGSSNGARVGANGRRGA